MQRILIMITLMTLTLTSCSSGNDDYEKELFEKEKQVVELDIENEENIQKLIVLQEEMDELNNSKQEKEMLLNNINNTKKKSSEFGIEKKQIDMSTYYETTEGSVAEITIHEEKIISAEINFFGEMGQKIERYYYIDKDIIYIEVEVISYSKPFDTVDPAVELTSYVIKDNVGYNMNEIGDLIVSDSDIEIVENLLNTIQILNKIDLK